MGPWFIQPGLSLLALRAGTRNSKGKPLGHLLSTSRLQVDFKSEPPLRVSSRGETTCTVDFLQYLQLTCKLQHASCLDIILGAKLCVLDGVFSHAPSSMHCWRCELSRILVKRKLKSGLCPTWLKLYPDCSTGCKSDACLQI